MTVELAWNIFKIMQARTVVQSVHNLDNHHNQHNILKLTYFFKLSISASVNVYWIFHALFWHCSEIVFGKGWQENLGKFAIWESRIQNSFKEVKY